MLSIDKFVNNEIKWATFSCFYSTLISGDVEYVNALGF